MDPNATLAQARAALARLDDLDEQEDAPYIERRAECAADVVDAFRALDEWLTKGGFQPAAWVHGAPSRPWSRQPD